MTSHHFVEMMNKRLSVVSDSPLNLSQRALKVNADNMIQVCDYLPVNVTI